MISKHDAVDALIVGSGPNGLAAAITLAQKGWSVKVLEAKESPGGALRSEELTLPGFIHDVGAAVVPLCRVSPFFRDLPLQKYGLAWIEPEIPLAHPFDDGSAATLERSLDKTAEALGRDGAAYARLIGPILAHHETLLSEILQPLHLPRHPLTLLRFGLQALRSAASLAEGTFQTERARGFFAGLAMHAMMPPDKATTAAFGIILAVLGHAVGWPMVRGGSGHLAEAMAGYLRDLGGEILMGRPVTTLDDLPEARAVVLDMTPRQILQIAGSRLPRFYRYQLQRYRYGPGVFKIDWALREPIPWRAEACRRAGTIHLGGTLGEISLAERDAAGGRHPEHPFVILAQQSLFDPGRAPAGRQTAWAYCHVPNGSEQDMTGPIEAQVERFAPGFRDLILAKHTLTAAGMERQNPNCVGGDINGGIQDLGQLFTRPAWRLVPYTTPVHNLFVCSSSTPPGGGVHGLCGLHAARAVAGRLK